MDIYAATNNSHKLAELLPLFPGYRIRSPREAGLDRFEVDEDGLTFLDNAHKKARTLYEAIGVPSLADDSGLCVAALGGEPGVRSARYGSPDSGLTKLDDAGRNAYLLERMRGREDRRCAFVCCLVLVLSPERFFAVQETCPGTLLESPRGEGGFGYDPVVYLPELDKTVAELSLEEKNSLSHRGRAASRMLALLNSLGLR